MYLNNLNTEEPSSLKIESIKFERRPDLDAATRVKIAIEGKYSKVYGKITNLSRQYQVSRTFIYMQIKLLDNLSSMWFGPKAEPSAYLAQLEKENNLRRLLSYRLIGGCSISKCSELLKLDGVKNTSYGWCCQQLHQAGSVFPNMVQWQGSVVFASDEIYYLDYRPILVTVDPFSAAILRIDLAPNLTKAGWEKHWNSLKAQGIIALSLVRDEGIVLKAAHLSALSDIDFQPDTFHAITHQLSKVEQRLIRCAHKAMELEYKAEKAFDSGVREAVLLKKWQKFEQAQVKTKAALEELELFQWLYHYLRHQLRVIRNDGQVRQSQEAIAITTTILELFEWLETDLSKEIKNINNLLPDLFNFLDKAQKVVEQLEPLIPAYILPFLMLSWQFHRLKMNTKNTAARKRLNQRFEWLNTCLKNYQEEHPQQYVEQKTLVFAQLDTIVQASSMVESVNALLRPLINESRGQVSQQMLNLFMFYYNHRVFQRGKRKGSAPIEILAGKKLEQHWLDLLMNILCPKHTQLKIVHKADAYLTANQHLAAVA